MRRAVVPLVALAAVLSGACDGSSAGDDDPRSPTVSTPPLIANYTVTVTNVDGETRTAELSCGTANTATGFLDGEQRYQACVTAVVPGPAFHFLKSGRRPTTCERHPEYSGWRARIQGRAWRGKSYEPVDREIAVDDACDEALWHLLKPMLGE
ncbi:MAG TPA: hypothetical protein VF230_02765 [Acidimicrobiales bacterium]